MIQIKSIQHLTKSYPELENELLAWNKLSRGNRLIPTEYVLRVIWIEANKELQKANTLL